jgi:molecular chaperone DnaJ
MQRNYYMILGVRMNASPEEIKAAFRRRALELHPDKSGQNSGPFIEAQQAYATLSDPERRRAYDRQLARQSVLPATAFRDIALDEFGFYHPSFDELFDRLWSNFLGLSRPKAERLESLTLEVILSPDEARTGGRVRVEIPARAGCPACGGRGHVGGYECYRCAGHGELTAEFPLDIPYPPGIRDGAVRRLPLTQFGIHNFYLTIQFRVSGKEAA